MPLCLLDLPSEVHYIVLQALFKVHKPSVRAFAGVSRLCRALSRPHLSHTLNLTLGPEDLVESIAQSLRYHAGLQYVTRLVIDGEWILPEDDPIGLLVVAPREIELFADELHGTLDQYDLLPELFSSAQKANLPYQGSFIANDAWQPLADLIQQLPALQDVVYLCMKQFPPRLLAALHHHHPQCRLHISNFFPTSLKGPRTDLQEFQLASSPCLYSLKANYTGSYPSYHSGVTPNDDYHCHVVLRMISGLAPSLKELTLVAPVSPGIPSLPPLPPWEGFSQEKASIPTSDSRRGALRYLRFRHPQKITKDDMKIWVDRTDFSLLEVLKLDTNVTNDLLDYLTTEIDFICLKTLVLGRNGCNRSNPRANAFLRKLRPLSSLTMEFWKIEAIVDDIAEAHGTSLIELKLGRPNDENLRPMNEHGLSSISQHCSLLRYLSLTLERTEGDSKEVARYKTLGSLPQLECVDLALHVSKRWEYLESDDEGEEPTIDPRFDNEFDQQIPPAVAEGGSQASNGVIRTQLTNCALDEDLGRAIFGAISAGKPQGSVPLEKLYIQMSCAEDLGEVECPALLVPVLRYLSKPVQVARNIKIDRRDELLVERLRKPIGDPPSEFPEWLDAIWCRIWSKKKLDKGWIYDWHSLPLASVDA